MFTVLLELTHETTTGTTALSSQQETMKSVFFKKNKRKNY